MIEITSYKPNDELVTTNADDEKLKSIDPAEYDFCFNEIDWSLTFKKNGKIYTHQGHLLGLSNKGIQSLQLLLFSLGESYSQPKDFDFLGPKDAVTSPATVSAMIRRLRKLLKEDGSGDQLDNFIQSVKRPYLIRFNPAYSYCWISRVPVSSNSYVSIK